MQNAGAPFFIDGLKSPRDSQNGYHFASMEAGSKLLSRSIGGWWKRTVQKSEIIAERACTPTLSALRVRECSALAQISRPIARAIAPSCPINVANSAGVNAWS